MTRAAATKHSGEGEELDVDRARLVRRGPRGGHAPRMTLRALRVAAGETQEAIAERTGIAQGDLSRIEQRALLDDSELRTLRRYVQALGGKLELVVEFPNRGHRIVLAGAGDD